MLIDPIKAALDSLHEALREEADHFNYAATLFEGRQSAEVFRALAAERTEMADEVEGEIRKRGLPKAADPDKEWVSNLVTRAKAVFSADDQAAVVAERQKNEQELVRRLTAALQVDLEQETRECLEQILPRLLQAQDQLRELKT